jgi:hypothetical protein
MTAITTHALTTPVLQRGQFYNFEAVDTHMADRSDHHLIRHPVARSVEVACTAEKPVTVLVQVSPEYDPEGAWSTLGRVEVEPGAEARGWVLVEPHRWARIRVEAGAKTGPVSVAATWRESERENER